MNGAADYNDACSSAASLEANEHLEKLNDALKVAERKKKRAELNLLKAAESCQDLRVKVAQINVMQGTSADFLLAARLCDELCKRQSELKIKIMEYEMDIEEIDDKCKSELRAIEAKAAL